jgi:hypothetical protein
MRILNAVACVLLIASIGVPLGFAKRRAPEPVTPVVHEEIRYEAPIERMGWVEAWDVKTGATLWDVQVYKVDVDPNLERDVQEVYITKLEIEGGDLLVTDERDREFLVDLKTHAVRRQ